MKLKLYHVRRSTGSTYYVRGYYGPETNRSWTVAKPMGVEAKRAKTARSRRALAKRDPKVIENPRTALIARGQKTCSLVNSALTDLYMLKKPFAVHFKRRNAIHPFEDASPLEFLCQKNDASIFALGTHSKKRPQARKTVSSITIRSRNSQLSFPASESVHWTHVRPPPPRHGRARYRTVSSHGGFSRRRRRIGG